MVVLIPDVVGVGAVETERQSVLIIDSHALIAASPEGDFASDPRYGMIDLIQPRSPGSVPAEVSVLTHPRVLR